VFRWEIERQLARSPRPGYLGEYAAAVPRAEVDNWVNDARTFGVRSIICLLADDQLIYYKALPVGLVDYYRDCGFTVEHVPVRDHQRPPLTAKHLEEIWTAFCRLPKPVLVHCSAGIDRTGWAVDYIVKRIG
jgi:protein tyrosine phosphatase (PTP) superfamily phosphohydrolase (DUF442 family)